MMTPYYFGNQRLNFLIAVCVFAIRLTLPQAQGDPLGEPDEDWARDVLASMSIEQKVGQVLCVPISYGQRADEGFGYRNLARYVTEVHIGAFHISGGRAENTAELINALQALAEIPLVFTADMEGGLGFLISDATLFPRGMALASTGDIDLVESCARAAAEESRALGIGINFYPVLDVNTDRKNIIINYRSFGDDPEAVAEYGIAFLRGTQSAGLIATGKHFPGHGHTHVDSHADAVVIGLGAMEFRTNHLFPFRAAIDAGIGAIMPGHITVPSLGESEVPATLSPRLTNDLLRHEMGFKGLIVTDAMTMGAITAHYSQEEAAVLALQAGADLIIFPPDPPRYARAIHDAVINGSLPPERLDDAAKNVLLAKSRVGLHRNRLVELDQVSASMKTLDHIRLSNRAAADSIILYRDTKGRLPVRLNGASVTVLQIGDLGLPPYESMGHPFVTEIEHRAKTVRVFRVGGPPSPEDFSSLLASVETADIIFCNIILSISAFKGHIDLSIDQKSLVEALRPFEHKTVLVTFGSPYVPLTFPWFESVVMGCDTMWEMQRAAVRAVAGESEFKGTLPVRLDFPAMAGNSFEFYR